MKKILFAVAFLATTLFSQTFTFTAIPDQDETKLKERFSKLAVYLTKELGVDVKFVPVKSYSASVAAFRNNQVQLAWFGGFSGVKARLLVKDSQAIAQGVEDPKFYSYIIAHKSTGLDKAKTLPEAVKGKTFTFGSKGSTSGRLMPEYFIRETFNAAPADVFKKVGFSGNHSKTISLVQSGAYELGAVNYKVWDRELKAGNIDTSKVKVIYKTPDYYDYNFTIRADVDKNYGEGFIKKVQAALLKLDDRDILDAFPRAKFIEAKNSDYDKVLETGRKIGLID
ncbi:putative selenate ABC transporter substrate-binding protein [Arcobacter roscoffensis]|uniref:Selenate ABC transporter substrate-binding protein n=1 Tax=Arcobacter roscoffensis TaxID=2961520 RepID=A0ABY5E8X0_9BACT|nr:putative selenate ABC transporter substrate-binding protein [Arcobacter roscoffensis]UTJ07615.1 putative selenate ABC transporter substrate-binding protein [Arcobacter roscoffensis]